MWTPTSPAITKFLSSGLFSSRPATRLFSISGYVARFRCHAIRSSVRIHICICVILLVSGADARPGVQVSANLGAADIAYTPDAGHERRWRGVHVRKEIAAARQAAAANTPASVVPTRQSKFLFEGKTYMSPALAVEKHHQKKLHAAGQVIPSGMALLLDFEEGIGTCQDTSGSGYVPQSTSNRFDWSNADCKRGSNCLRLKAGGSAGSYPIKIPCLEVAKDWSFTAWVKTAAPTRTQSVFFIGNTYDDDWVFTCKIAYDAGNALACNASGMAITTTAGLQVHDRVRVKDKDGEEWKHGTVVSLNPLRVKPDGWTNPAGYRFNNVELSNAPTNVVTDNGNTSAVGDGSSSSTNAGTGLLETGPDTVDWHHFAVTRTSGEGIVQLYWDGRLYNTEFYTKGEMPHRSAQFYIGTSMNVNDDLENTEFDGYMDEVTVWQRTLSPKEVRKIYAQTSAFTGVRLSRIVGRMQLLLDFEDTSSGTVIPDTSGNNFRVTKGATASWSTSACQRGIGCLNFAGVEGGKPVEISCLKLRQDWSFTAWVKTATETRTQTIFFAGKTYNASYSFYCQVRYNIGSVFCEGPSTEMGTIETQTDLHMSADQWHHFAVTRNSIDGTVAIFWDGSPKQAQVLGTGGAMPSGDPVYDPPTFLLGDATGKSNSAFSGTMDEVSVWSRMLTAAEVQQIYQSPGPLG